MDLIITKKIIRFIDVYQHCRAARKAAAHTAIYSKCGIPIEVGVGKKAEIIQQGMNIAGYEEYSPTPSITLNFSQLQLKWTR